MENSSNKFKDKCAAEDYFYPLIPPNSKVWTKAVYSASVDSSTNPSKSTKANSMQATSKDAKKKFKKSKKLNLFLS